MSLNKFNSGQLIFSVKLLQVSHSVNYDNDMIINFEGK